MTENDRKGWLARRRLRRAVDLRDDMRVYASKWGWSWLPSEARRRGRQYDKADARVVRLGGRSEPWPRGADR